MASAPTHYNFDHEDGVSLYNDRPLSGPNAATAVTDAIVHEHDKSPLLMLGSVKFADFEQTQYTVVNSGWTIAAAEPFAHNECDYDPYKMHPMYRITDRDVFCTNAGQSVLPTGLKILYDQLSTLGGLDQVKAALIEGITVNSDDDADKGDGFYLSARETDSRSDAQIWYKVGGLQVVLQIRRSPGERVLILATRD